MTYEAHITLAVDRTTEVSRELARTAAAIAEGLGWKSSHIDGDPVLGVGVKSYLTKHAADGQSLLIVMQHTAAILRAAGLDVLRQKVEHVVYDTATGVDLIGSQ